VAWDGALMTIERGRSTDDVKSLELHLVIHVVPANAGTHTA